jgi:hypothetical protein
MRTRRLTRLKKRHRIESSSNGIELQEFARQFKITTSETQSASRPPRNADEAFAILARAYHVNLVDEEKKAHPTCCDKTRQQFARVKEWMQDLTFREVFLGVVSALLILPTTAADTSSIPLGMQQMDRPLLGHIECNNTNLWIITVAYFCQSLIVNGPEVIEGINKSIRIIDKGELPSHWGKLTPKKERLAAFLAILFTMYSSIAEGTATYGFFQQLSWDYSSSIAIASIYVLTNILSEGRKTWENIRNRFCDQPYEEEHRIGTKVVGYTLATFSAIGAVILGYDGITSTWGVPGLIGKIGLLAASTFKGYSDISYSGEINMGAIDECAEEIEKNGCPKLSQVAAILPSIYFGSLVADSLAVVYTTSLATAALPFAIPAIACTVIGYGVAVSQGLTVTYGTLSLLNPITAKVGKWIWDAGVWCGFCKPEDPDPEFQQLAAEEEKIAPESPVREHVVDIPDERRPNPQAETMDAPLLTTEDKKDLNENAPRVLSTPPVKKHPGRNKKKTVVSETKAAKATSSAGILTRLGQTIKSTFCCKSQRQQHLAQEKLSVQTEQPSPVRTQANSSHYQQKNPSMMFAAQQSAPNSLQNLPINTAISATMLVV